MSLYIKLVYRSATDDFEPLETNVAEEQINEVLSEWVRSQIGAGRDDSPPTMLKQHVVKIVLDTSDDSFAVQSDTGNKGLTTGIVMHLLATRRRKAAGSRTLRRDT